jgi:hypothetical protein
MRSAWQKYDVAEKFRARCTFVSPFRRKMSEKSSETLEIHWTTEIGK